MNVNLYDKDQKFESISEGHIELKFLFGVFFRNKRIISLLSILFFVIACLYSFSIKKVWEGQFQLVLNSNNNNKVANSLIDINPLLGNLVGLSNSNNLQTEVDILKSPSVLMPIFEFAISQDPEQSLREASFKKWIKSKLKMELQKGTSILNISYRDTRKNDILPVLDLMTKEFQKYKGFQRKKDQKLLKEYLNNQIQSYKIKSSQSLKAAQEFAIDEDLIFLDNFSNFKSMGSEQQNNIPNISLNPFDGNSSTLSSISSENYRVRSSNEIKTIDLQLEKINNIGDDLSKLEFIGLTMPSLSLLQNKLIILDENINQLKTIYKENDPLLNQKVKEKDALIKLIKNRVIGILNSRRDEAQVKKEAATRPKEVLLKYKELLRKAIRDDSTLINLENQLRIIELENAKKESPWQLITKPTLLKKHVAPVKRNIALIGLFLGFAFGSFIAFIKEKISDKVFEPEIVEQITKSPLIENIKLEDINSKSDAFQYLIDFINTFDGKKVYLISLYGSDNKVFKQLKQLMKECFKGKEVEIINGFSNLKRINKNEVKVLFTSIDIIKYSQLNKLMNRLNAFKLELDGFILLTRS